MAITNRSLRTARTKGETVCAQHHVPRSQCPPSSGHPRSVRFRDDDWAAAEEMARARNTDTGPLIISAAQAVLGYVRCYRCPVDDPPVPLQCGDLTGRTLAEAITEAEKRATKQHPAHKAVWLGAEPGQVQNPPGPRCGHPIGDGPCGRPEGHPGRHMPTAPQAVLAPRCEHQLPRAGLCGRPAGHPGDHQSETALRRKYVQAAQAGGGQAGEGAWARKPPSAPAVFREPDGARM
jgi:hypothetical protein